MKNSLGSLRYLHCVVLVLMKNGKIQICSINRIGVEGIVNKITSVCTHVSSWSRQLHTRIFILHTIFQNNKPALFSQWKDAERFSFDDSIRTGVRCAAACLLLIFEPNATTWNETSGRKHVKWRLDCVMFCCEWISEFDLSVTQLNSSLLRDHRRILDSCVKM